MLSHGPPSDGLAMFPTLQDLCILSLLSTKMAVPRTYICALDLLSGICEISQGGQKTHLEYRYSCPDSRLREASGLSSASLIRHCPLAIFGRRLKRQAHLMYYQFCIALRAEKG